MRHVITVDCEVVELPATPPDVLARAVFDRRCFYATETRTRMEGATELREVSTDGGKTWTIDRRRFVGTSPTPLTTIKSEEL